MRWPHDDTASLIAFYGDPHKPGFDKNLVLVSPPWQMTYDGKPIKGVRIHRKCADSLKAVFDDIARQVGHDWSKLPDGAVKFSGSYNFRPVRGSSRLSCHAFGAAIDMDAEENPMNSRGDLGTMDDIVISAFKRQGWYWGGDFTRKDPMHFQAAHEASRFAEVIDTLNPVSTAEAAEPPMVDAHGSLADEAALPQTTIEDTEETPKPLLKSKIAWLQGAALSAFGLGNADKVDMSTVQQAFSVIKSPGMLTLIAVGCLLATIYFRWKDYGRGQK